MRTLLVLMAALLTGGATRAQVCPPQNGDAIEASGVSVLHGMLLLHDELRQWLGLKLDRKACGQTEIELVFSTSEDWGKAETLLGCAISASGRLYDSPTGYYATDMAISNAILKPDASCHASAVKPDPSAAPIPPTVTAYHASITVDYRGKGHVNVSVRQGDNKAAPLAPWQAYVNYMLTGGQDIVRFDCQKGFQIGDIKQTPTNPNGLLDDVPNLSGAALQDLNGINTIEFACQKKP